MLLALAASAFAMTGQAADPPSAVQCKDGTTSAHAGRGACSGHGGIDRSATAGKATGGGNAADTGAAKPRRAPSAAAGTSTTPSASQVLCKDGTTSAHGGRGACNGHRYARAISVLGGCSVAIRPCVVTAFGCGSFDGMSKTAVLDQFLGQII